ncbi:hypothetical protein XENOCAPTIV_000351 [Xenoophorus captivus]|uniref:Uncharacterized protein n=1 Tax=Xenoophorus captivus TaxID=1517983 RepID=A0ABV0Q467_9TELE
MMAVTKPFDLFMKQDVVKRRTHELIFSFFKRQTKAKSTSVITQSKPASLNRYFFKVDISLSGRDDSYNAWSLESHVSQGCLWTTVIVASISLCSATYPATLPSMQQLLNITSD